MMEAVNDTASRPMAILHVTDQHRQHSSGVWHTLQSAAAPLRRGHRVILLTPDKGEAIFAPRARGYVDRDKNVHRFPMAASFSFIEKLLGLELEWRIPLPLFRSE